MDIQLELGTTHTDLHVSVTGRLDVHNAAAFQQVMWHLQKAGGSGFRCDVTSTEIADAAARSAIESVRHHTEEFGGSLVARPGDVPPGHQNPAAPGTPSSHGPGGGAPGPVVAAVTAPPS